MNIQASALSFDGRERTPTDPTLSRVAKCGRHTTMPLDNGPLLNTGSGLRVVAFLMSRFAGDKSLSDLAVAAAVCRDDGTLVHQLDDMLVGLPPEACLGVTADPEASWHRTLQTTLQNVDVVVTPDAWAQRQSVEAVHNGFARLDWGCARKDIDWHGVRLPSDRLTDIRIRFDVLRRNRRALDECHFVLAILTQPSSQGQKPPLAQLLASVDAEVVRLFAGDVPAAHMPALEQRGYRWSPGQNGAPVGLFVDRKQDGAQAERRFLGRLLGRDEAELLERPLPADQRYRLP